MSNNDQDKHLMNLIYFKISSIYLEQATNDSNWKSSIMRVGVLLLFAARRLGVGLTYLAVNDD